MYPFYFDPRKSISHLLILISVVISIIGFIVPNVVYLYGFHPGFLDRGDYISFVVQLVLFQFLHGGFLHLLFNSYFLYSAGPELERRMSRDRYVWFFVSSTLFVAMSLYFFAPNSLTIGISGFCMALLSYLWIDLYTLKHPLAAQIGFMLLVNILLGLTGNISFVGHVSGAIWGLIWWQMRKGL